MAYGSGREHQSGGYRVPAHQRAARARRSRWGVGVASLVGLAGALALITMSGGIGGATPDVPAALQVGVQASTTSLAPSTRQLTTHQGSTHQGSTHQVTTHPAHHTTTPSTPRRPATTSTTLAPRATAVPGGGSTSSSTATPTTTVAPTTVRPTSTTTTPTRASTSPLTIVIPKSKVTVGSDSSDDWNGSSPSTTKHSDN
ncbi:MAG: hypothetical protein PXZ08_05360 [Actinomycetota bacterium]|nr:hypothetical protein [Actinomycetota bacterium]